VCRCWKTWPHLAVGWFWFGGTLVPVIGIVQVGQAAMADRYMYLPLIGLSVMVAYSAGKPMSRGRAVERAIALVAGVSILAMGVATRNQVRLWKDSTTLFEHALAVTDRNHVAHINIGVALVNEQRYAEAEAHLRRAVAIAPGSALAHGVLADALRGQSKTTHAIEQYRAALILDPGSPRWLGGLANALLDAGRTAEAVDAYRRALEREPSAAAYANLGLALLNRGSHPEAIENLERALELKPNFAVARGNLGIALLESKQPDAAIGQLQLALERDPDLALVRANLALALAERDGDAAGLESIALAIRSDPDNPKFHTIAARLARGANRFDLAIAHYRSAIALGDRNASNLNDLAWLLATDPEHGAAAEAMGLALEAAEASDHPSADVLDTLAVAYAANGRWQDALKTSLQVLSMVESDDSQLEFAQQVRKRIARYRAEAE